MTTVPSVESPNQLQPADPAAVKAKPARRGGGGKKKSAAIEPAPAAPAETAPVVVEAAAPAFTPPVVEPVSVAPLPVSSPVRRRYQRRYYPRPQIATGSAAKFNTARLEQSYELRRSSYTTLDGRRYENTLRLWDKVFFTSGDEIEGDELTAFLEDWGSALPRQVVNGLLRGVPLYIVPYKPTAAEIDWFDQSYSLPVTTLVCALARPDIVSRPPQRFRIDGRPIKRDRRFVYVDGEADGKGGYTYGFSIFGSFNMDDPGEEHADDCVLFFEWEPVTGCAADAFYKLDFARGIDSLCALDHLRIYLNSILFGNVEEVPEDEEDEEGDESVTSRVAASPDGSIPQRTVRREKYPAPPDRSGLGDHGGRRSPPPRRGYVRREPSGPHLDLTAAAQKAPVVEQPKPPVVVEAAAPVAAPPPAVDPKQVRWCIRKECTKHHQIRVGVTACDGVYRGKTCEKPLTIPKATEIDAVKQQLLQLNQKPA